MLAAMLAQSRFMNDATKLTSIFHSFGFALAAADQFGAALWRGDLEKQVTQPQFLCLTELNHTPGIGHFDLADRVGIDRATIGPILKRLMELGHVTREKDPRDSRRSVLTVRPEAVQKLKDLVPSVQAMSVEFMQPLNAMEQSLVLMVWAAVGQDISMPITTKDSTAVEYAALPRLVNYPWFYLRLACRAYRRIWREHVGDAITPSQLALLEAVASASRIDIRTAAKQASVEESTAVRMVMRLVRTRLMLDPRDPADARRSLLSLTAAGTDTLADVTRQIPSIQTEMCRHMPPLVEEVSVSLTRRIARLA